MIYVFIEIIREITPNRHILWKANKNLERRRDDEGTGWEVGESIDLKLALVNKEFHSVLHWMGQGHQVGNILIVCQRKLVSAEEHDNGDECFESRQVLTEAHSRSGVESRPTALSFTAKVALRRDPAFWFEFFGIRAPDLLASTASPRRPRNIVALADLRTVRPHVILKRVLLVHWD